MTHIDEWLDKPNYTEDEGERYARYVLELFRYPAWKKAMYSKYVTPLFCTYQGKRYKVTGASRMGDIWLAEDFTQMHGYDKRVDVAECSEWKAIP